MSLYDKETYLINKAINDYIELNSEESLDVEIMNDLAAKVEACVADNAEAVCKLIRDVECSLLYADDEIKRIQANKKKDLKKINSLKMFLEPYVKEKSLKQLGTFKVSLRKSSKVNIVDESLIPEDFKQYDEVLKIDKLKIKEALKSQDVDGCELITNETLQIK
jgi:hypothetical protein